ncbi:phytanoyl-CoA dioxygenase family protein [Yoonia sediminilitoris]|uniref:Ectoine hydroxylase-related dioxygenase (Phytanoyl-CoA dioxygenase family) n=1 Tax=Yoonia sediminilitoris TaxID=1286148 RepID=A0A2T6KQV0_9RHOB|nr:phytanoyl-CoA dioxygenase family protein [Yoonia sediminilitoris]PUB18944.1 ectoine hydroxylase-related dioxygenase (phytanoyl-CoA dioxygenase family) [Yoonia sediminilitoris]RCW99112.1 ectoine hydroxylase-related dioxygenase (phytanoyl-CoA dioxygenase family) [Yoonia sediminilitoris]
MLTQAQKQDFEQNGYLVLPDIIPQDVIAAVRQEYATLMDDLFAGWVREGRVTDSPGLSFWDKLSLSYAAGCDWFQPMDISLPGDVITTGTPMHFGPAIFDLVMHDRLLGIIEALIGPEITLNPIQHVRIKPPAPQLSDDEIRAHVTSTEWHQDRGVGHEQADSTEMITAWVAITDATVENGCLQAVPGIDAGLLPHCPQKQTAIAPGALDKSKAVPLPVPSGGVVLFHPLVAHASLPNLSDGFRWSFDLRFNVTGQHTGREHFPKFIARSAAAPETVLTDWRKWKLGWEDARATLASEPHIPIHRWSADAPVCA